MTELLLTIERLAAENTLDSALPLIPAAVAQYEQLVAALAVFSRKHADAAS